LIGAASVLIFKNQQIYVCLYLVGVDVSDNMITVT
jgi:hypothetical protein